MFVEKKNSEAAQPNVGRLDAFGQRHPGVFTAALAVLAAATAVALLYQRGATFVLYQGF
ncbi:MAG: hypothetical protein NVV62_14455 [Terricaulis sp.]|nr:hypothetical protein [Terricaulis sp.]